MTQNSRTAWLQDINWQLPAEFFQVRQTAWLEFIKENQFQFLLMVVFLFLAGRQFRAKQVAAKKAGADRQWCDAPAFPEIERLEGFKWQDTAPVKLRAFKPKYHLTMGEFIVAQRRPYYASAY